MGAALKWARWVGGTVGTLTAPPAILSAYFLSTGPGRNMDYDWPAVILSTITGAACLAMLPIAIMFRIVGVIVYIPLATIALILYAIMFVCGAFGACL
jgi:hypothetical protein